MKRKQQDQKEPHPSWVQDKAAVDSAEARELWAEPAIAKTGDMKLASFALGEHISAGIVFAGTQEEADYRAQRLVDGWNGDELKACRQGRIGDAEHIGRLLTVISGLKTGSCWCAMGIGHPSVQEHSLVCKAAAIAVGEKL